MIQAQGLCKGYAGQNLLDDVSFNINSRERVGLVGRNGHGKTTLFRILLGQEEPDSGSVTIPRNYRLGHLDQHIKFTQESVLQEACIGLPPEHIHDIWRAEKILSGLGFSADDMKRHPQEFSGGYQVRINLAKVLASNPNMLLLDEPTNYLDIVSIRWLERFLNAWKGELLLVTHDRAFMDNVTTHTMIIHRRKVKKIEGGTDKLYQQIAKEEEIHEKTRQNDERRRKEVELFITRFRAKARLGGMVQSRVKLLEKQDRLSKLEHIKDLEFSFRESEFDGKWTIEAKNLTFAYPGGPKLIQNFSILIGKEDRVGIIGKNGKGKSTLLRMFAGLLNPVSGVVQTHPQCQPGYFGQTNIEQLNEHLTIEEEIMHADPDRSRQKARDIAGSMLFEGEMALKRISVLSGGEKSRVLLSKLLVSPTQLLMLDEPTNHLDMQSCDSLLEALDTFDGSVVIVTHNEMFLKALVNRLIIFDHDGIRVFEGGYQDFLNEVGWESEEDLKKDEEKNANNKKEQRRARAEILQEKTKLLKPLAAKVKKFEDAITAKETEQTQTDQLLVDASVSGDGKAIADLAKKSNALKQEIALLYDELSIAMEEHDKAAAEFIEE